VLNEARFPVKAVVGSFIAALEVCRDERAGSVPHKPGLHPRAVAGDPLQPIFAAASPFFVRGMQGKDLHLQAESMAGQGMVQIKNPVVALLPEKTAGAVHGLVDTADPVQHSLGIKAARYRSDRLAVDVCALKLVRPDEDPLALTVGRGKTVGWDLDPGTGTNGFAHQLLHQAGVEDIAP
jgi:hypothetical protein